MSYTKELEDGLQRLETELGASRNDIRLSDGLYAMAKTNILLLEGSLAAKSAEVKKCREVLCFFASVIKSGESWSQTCETELRAALAQTQGGAALASLSVPNTHPTI